LLLLLLLLLLQKLLLATLFRLLQRPRRRHDPDSLEHRGRILARPLDGERHGLVRAGLICWG
jgi:hypothetical protein